MNLSLLPSYLLDTETVVGLARRMNPPELRKSACQIVDRLIGEGRILCPLEVLNELEYHNTSPGDEAVKWAKDRKHIFKDITERQQECLAQVLAQFPSSVKYDSDGYDADPILVAMGMDLRWAVVTRDGIKDSPGMIRIHQVCRHFGVDYKTDFEFLKENGWQI